VIEALTVAAASLALGVAQAEEASLSPGTAQAAEPAVVWAVGDGADGSAVARRLARRIERNQPDAFLYLGDVYPSGTASDFAGNYAPVYGGLAAITWPTPGNHDWGNRASGYFPYWRARVGGRPWYRFDAGGWEILSLNSEARHVAGSAQMRWLGRVLREADGTCRLAFWHRPRFSAGTVHGNAPDVAPFWAALRGHARLVVNGHEHAMMRYRRRAGLTEYVSGAGGRITYALRRDPRLAFARTGVTGALRIALEPGRARLAFRDVAGRLLDASQARCERAPSSPATLAVSPRLVGFEGRKEAHARAVAREAHVGMPSSR
jgi:hypothetical protein